MYQYMKKEFSSLSSACVGWKPFPTRKLIYALVIAVPIIFALLYLARDNSLLAHRLDVLSETVKNQGIRLDQQISSLSQQVKIVKEKLIADEVMIEQNHKYLLQLRENFTLMLHYAKSEGVTNSSFQDELYKQEVKKHLSDIDRAIESFQIMKKHLSDIDQDIENLQNKQEMKKHVANESLQNQQEMEKRLADINLAIEKMSNSVFKHCHSGTESCEIGSRGDAPYWRACRTNFLPIKEPVSLYTGV